MKITYVEVAGVVAGVVVVMVTDRPFLRLRMAVMAVMAGMALLPCRPPTPKQLLIARMRKEGKQLSFCRL